ncbi:hypothetical protein BpHYR1_033954 [Brachionus plicatilis]|uniref:Uncharacterized protein n=1 Tax=Brachionus plicatilis TaxID=10195 RepID=A0A3M7QCM4_BRAPC|nr:hypothetical protein BpHYR1_033954 [Brachionus plicatilis]
MPLSLAYCSHLVSGFSFGIGFSRGRVVLGAGNLAIITSSIFSTGIPIVQACFKKESGSFLNSDESIGLGSNCTRFPIS